MPHDPPHPAGPADEETSRGTEAWKAQTKAIERVIDVALTLEQPRTAGWLAEEAAVAEQTARDHLELLTDLGMLTATTAHGVTRYQPETAYVRFRTVSRCVEQYTKDELLDAVEQLREQTAAIETEYDVETPDELRALTTTDETPIEEIKDYRRVAAEWESLRHRLSVFQEAVERYEDFDRGAVTA
jgi:predicted ArsR family transcriptional regulator